MLRGPAQAEARLTLQQRFRIAKAQSKRLLARAWNEADHPRVPAGSPDGGQFGSGGGGAEGAKPGGGKSKKPAKKEDFDKAKVTLPPDKAAQDAFIGKWNDKVGVDPAEFKSKFMGGLDGPMRLSATGNQINVNGEIHDNGGRSLGVFERNINLDTKSAYSAYFKLNKSATKGDIGKKMLAGNVETYKNLGIEKLSVTANIDVGGYAWAKYGYVPTQQSWNELRGELERKLTGGSHATPRGDNTMEAESWDMLSSDVQDDVRDRWMRDSREEFLDSEIQNWRDSGQALEDSKNALTDLYNDDAFIPEWASDAFDAVRETREDAGDPPIPYTNLQLFKATSLDYKSTYGDGRDDPEVTFDDEKLKEPQGYDPAQQTLPGIEPLDPSQFLSQEMRDQLESEMTDSFNKKAGSDADDIDPPDYLADGVAEYQEEYWDQKDDDEKLRHAIDYDMANIEIEPDEDDEEPQQEMDLPESDDDPVLEAVRSSDPKSIWKVADSPQGKALLLGTGWSGVLNLKDKASMDRFNAYVGKAHG